MLYPALAPGQSGLIKQSFALVDHLRSIDKRRVRRIFGNLLSAQSTDKAINRVTPALFARWPTPAALAAAPQEAVEALVKPTGFFRNKAKAIRGAAKAIALRHSGRVPKTLDELVELPGVARKTANVVLGTALGVQSGIVVDTQVGRVSRRLGLTDEADPEKVERALLAVIPSAPGSTAATACCYMVATFA